MKSLNFAIIGDAHIDKDFSAFDAALAVIDNNLTDFVFIPGDLFELRRPDDDVVSHVKNAFSSRKKTTFVIACGNHDPFTADSPYKREKWPENVHIFTENHVEMKEFQSKFDETNLITIDRAFSDGNIFATKKGIRIYGASFGSHYEQNTLFCDKTKSKLPKLLSGYVNVLVMHGDFSETSTFNPLNPEVIKEYGFDICAVGGPHEYFKNGEFLCSGIICGRNFDETGDKGIIVGEILEDGSIKTEFVPLGVDKYELITYDVTELATFSAKNVAEHIKELAGEGTSQKITLTGSVRYGEKIDTETLKNELLTKFKAVEIVDKTEHSDSLSMISHEKTPRGIFARILLDKAKRIACEEDSPYKAGDIDGAADIAFKFLESNGGVGK